MDKMMEEVKELLFKDVDKAGETVQRAKEKLEAKGKALDEAKQRFEEEYKEQMEYINTPKEEAELAQRRLDTLQAELLQSDDLTSVRDLQSEISELESLIEAQEKIHNNRLAKDKPEVLTAYETVRTATRELEKEVNSFNKAVSQFRNNHNRGRLNSFVKEYKSKYPDGKALGHKLDELNMLEEGSIGTRPVKILYLSDGNGKRVFRNL